MLLKTAKKLKNAGLTWEPQMGDFFAIADDGEELIEQGEIASTNIYVISGERNLVDALGGRMVFFGGGLCVRGSGNYCNETHCYCMNKTGYNPDINIFSVASWDKKLWVPCLDQLLAEIEKRGYVWDISLNPAQDHKYACWVVNKDGHNCPFADSPEEAAALGLLWILSKEVTA